MGFNINIDIGGTFTDFFAGHDGRGNRITKTPTTHYDLSVGFMRGIRDLAGAYDLSFQNFLGQTDQVRYCTTLGTNSLIERTGPKLGLITTAGFEDAIVLGRGRSWADGIIAQDNKDLSRINKPIPLISRDNVVGVRERIDSFGQVICPLNRDEILEKLQYLVDQGAMGLVLGRDSRRLRDPLRHHGRIDRPLARGRIALVHRHDRFRRARRHRDQELDSPGRVRDAAALAWVGLREAIERAGEVRFLPVLLTSLTAIGGLTPLALEGAPLYSPLAMVLIGGLVSSTLLARIVTPAMYLLLAPKDPAPFVKAQTA